MDIKPTEWRGFSAPEKLVVLVLFLLAVSVAIIPFLDEIFIRRLARQTGLRSQITWLINDNGSWIVSIGLLALLALFLLWKRRQLLANRHLWFGTGCPNCQERELVRVSRKAGDRYYGLVGIPAYRYACRNCTWRGLRIARREHSPEMDAELEQALLRFDPDEPRIRPSTDDPSATAVHDVSDQIVWETEPAVSEEVPAAEEGPLTQENGRASSNQALEQTEAFNPPATERPDFEPYGKRD